MRVISVLTLVFIVSTSVQADVIASCGPSRGHSYFYESDLVEDFGWEEGRLESSVIFIGDDVVSDVIIKGKDLEGKDWTRSASDYGAPVFEVNRVGDIRHILIVWRGDTELYMVDTAKKVFALVSHKSGMIEVTHAFVGECE